MIDDDDAAFGERLRERRTRLGMTQEHLAAAADVAVKTIRNAEAGKPIRPSIRRRIERALASKSRKP